MASESVPHAGLTHLKEYNVKDSNVELIGSEIDHKVKYNSAQTEPAWNSVGKAAGIFVWRIEKFHVVPWPQKNYGTFHEGDSYIVLHSQEAGPDSEELLHNIYFWLGKTTTQDESGTAAYKTVELDEYLHCTATQHREVQGCESEAFVSLFSRITILQGGIESGFNHVDEDEQEETLILYRITKIQTQPASIGTSTPTKQTKTLVQQVEPTWQSLVEDDCFVLDRGTRVFVWQGKNCSPMEKGKAAQVAHDMTLSRQAQAEVVAQTDARAYLVLEALGGSLDSPIASSSASSREQRNQRLQRRSRTLFRISDASGSLRFDKVKTGPGIGRSDLDSNDVFLLDAGTQLWIWQGKQASRGERSGWLKVVQAYLKSDREEGEEAPALHSMPISKVVDGHEGLAFQRALTTSA